MYKKVTNYLNNLDKKNRTCFDMILSFYAKGNLEKYLANKGAFDITFYPTINKKVKSLQVDFTYFNFYVGIEFNENTYEYFMCEKDNPQDDYVSGNYAEDFDVKKLLSEIFESIKSRPQIDKTKGEQPIKQKNKTRKIVFIVSLLLCVTGMILVYFFNESEAITWVALILCIGFLVVLCVLGRH